MYANTTFAGQDAGVSSIPRKPFIKKEFNNFKQPGSINLLGF